MTLTSEGLERHCLNIAFLLNHNILESMKAPIVGNFSNDYIVDDLMNIVNMGPELAEQMVHDIKEMGHE